MDHCAFALAGLRLLLQLSLPVSGPRPQSSNIIDSVPRDTRSILNGLCLSPATKELVCCPKCFCCYSLQSYPERCTNQDTPSSPVCQRRLKKEPVKGSEASGLRKCPPTRLYVYHDFKEWLARLHSRPEIEKYLERNLAVNSEERLSGVHQDIWDAPALQDFLGPDGRKFIAPDTGEGRYIFSLNMDGFNPFQRKQAGKKASSGAIYMICLNLPPEIRYKPENMFLVGIIPGPHEPSLHQINHLLRPLVDDLLIAWHDGIRLSRTALHPTGRTVRCAVVPLVCDLPAARQMAGYAPCISMNCCSYCLLKLQEIDNFDESTWLRMSWEEHLSIAMQWRDAPSEAARCALYDKHGVRWSELLRLPYWDPTKFTLLDSMHTLLLILIQKHCREVWGMDDQFDDGPGATYNKLVASQPPSFDQIQNGSIFFEQERPKISTN